MWTQHSIVCVFAALDLGIISAANAADTEAR
jgi:hypothetical protein